MLSLLHLLKILFKKVLVWRKYEIKFAIEETLNPLVQKIIKVTFTLHLFFQLDFVFCFSPFKVQSFLPTQFTTLVNILKWPKRILFAMNLTLITQADWTWVGGLKFCWKDYSDDMWKLGGGSFKFFEIGDAVI